MLQVNLRRDLSRLAMPIFIETLLITMMGGVDTFMLSQYDDNAVGAVGMVNQLMAFALLIFQVINLGTSVLCSQYIGAGQRGRMVQVTGVAMLLNLFLGIVVSATLCVAAPWLLTAMGLRPELMQHGVPYMRIVGAFLFFQAIHTTISASLRADKKAIYPMVVVCVINVINIIANYVLIFGHWGFPSLGATGAAIATAFSRGIAMVLLLVVLFWRHIHFRAFMRVLMHPRGTGGMAEVGSLLRIGLPSAGENMSYNAQQIVIAYFINRIGNDELTTFTYVTNISIIAFVFCICMALAGSISIGHLVGEHKPHAAYVLGNWILKWSTLITLSLAIVMALGGKQIFSLLTDNAYILSLGTTIMYINVLREFGRVVNIYSTNVLRATGDVMFPFYLGVIVQWTAGVLCGWLFGLVFGWGLIGMWVAFILDENIRGAVFIWRWRSMKWARKAFV